MTVSFDEDKQDKRLDEFKRREEEDVAQIVASRYDLEYVDLAPVPINMDALRLIPEHDARDSKTAAFSLVGKKIKVAVVSPVNERSKDVANMLKQKGYEVTLAVASPLSLEKAWSRYADLSFSTETKAGALDISSEDIKTFIGQIHTIEDVRAQITEILKLKKGFRISKILEIVLSGALATKASDVHVEPEEAYVRLRYRLDGVLTDILSFDTETFGLLLSRIKLLSGLKLNIKSEAQDGRFSVKIGEDEIEIRTSILPGAYNESVVLRLLNPKSIQVPLEDLGIHEKLLGILMKEIGKPNGMILTTGPTGSGKTTTLYAFMRKIHTPQVKIITIEDPIEYHLPGIVQTQVNAEKNYTFDLGLRSALRQDPDVIMVGEIRDNETAQTAINSALTGHLVFSTLHTNDAAGSFPRLIDLGVNPRVISSAVTIALAQRLVRKLCPDCKRQEPLQGADKAAIDGIVAGIVDRALAPTAADAYWKPVGCAKCNNTGYSGRVGIYEGILITEEINKAIEYSTSESEIAKAARPQGVLSMLEDGIIKVLKGVTSLEELERVISIEN
ncbi:MAG TPA: type II/IV secretion system protein [Candidatus Paceibacterota bacterium]|nr:type II/IV secretion system protein [Candidatus Paceibacterota bacterium]